MTHYEAALRKLDDNEKHHDRAIAKLETQVRLLGGYRDELEDEVRTLTAETERLRGLLKAQHQWKVAS